MGSAQYSVTPYDKWQMKAISFTPEVSSISLGSPEVVVVVMDTGIDFTHEDLGENLKWKNPGEISGIPFVDDDGNGYIDDYYGWDFVDNDNDPSPYYQKLDDNGNGVIDESVHHGTGIAGIIAGQGKNVRGIVPNIRIMDVKVFNSDGSLKNLSRALNYVEEISQRFKSIKVINFSGVFGNNIMKTVNETINRLIYNLDVTFVGTTGNKYNEGVYNVSAPANHPDIISVGSIDEDLDISVFSQRGEGLDFVAPGENIFSLAIDNQINNNLDGTSFAAPFITGAVAYINSLYLEDKIDIKLDRKTIFNLLKDSSTDLGNISWDSTFGYGLLNMTKLIKNIKIQEKSAFTNVNLIFMTVSFALLVVLRNNRRK